MKYQACQEAGYVTARPLEGWLDDGWPGEGIFPHAVAYGTGMGICAGCLGGGSGDCGRTCMDHVCDVSWRHERGRRPVAIIAGIRLVNDR